MIDIELQRTRSAMAESVTLPIATWLEVLDELEALRQVEPVKQEPVATVKRNEDDSLTFTPLRDFYVVNGMELYAAPVRTKDLTDDEIEKAFRSNDYPGIIGGCRAVIAADRRKNNANNNT